VQAVAYAYGSNHAISGTCYQDGSWYVSNTVRTRSSGADSSQVHFDRTPYWGIDFFVQDYPNGTKHGIVFAPNVNYWLPLANGDAPYQFVNWFRLDVPGRQANYDFSGTEQY
jgi:hypothetical protein